MLRSTVALLTVTLTASVAYADIKSVEVNTPSNWDASLILHYRATENLDERQCYDKVWDSEALKYKKIPKTLHASAHKKAFRYEGYNHFYGSNLKLKRNQEKCAFKAYRVYLYLFVPGKKDPGGEPVGAYLTLNKSSSYNGQEQVLECKEAQTLYCDLSPLFISEDGRSFITVN